jgi:hypothetical protein
MSKCKYTYMYFPLYKQVVLSEETVFNEGEHNLYNTLFKTIIYYNFHKNSI